MADSTMPEGYELWEFRAVTPESTAALIAEAERRGAARALEAAADYADEATRMGLPSHDGAWLRARARMVHRRAGA